MRRWRIAWLRPSIARSRWKRPAFERLRARCGLSSAPLRRPLAALAAPTALEDRLAESIAGTLAVEATSFRGPTSALWSVIGAAQYVVTAFLIFSVLWFASLFVIHDAPVSAVSVPYLGFVPTPVVLLAATLLAGYVLAKLLQLHAGWLGRRWARQVGVRVTSAVRGRITDDLLAPLDEFDASRAALEKAVRTADDCSGAAT